MEAAFKLTAERPAHVIKMVEDLKAYRESFETARFHGAAVGYPRTQHNAPAG
jgi:hypothetical protein